MSEPDPGPEGADGEKRGAEYRGRKPGQRLIAVASELHNRQLAGQAKAFEQNGGFTERLYHYRKNKKDTGCVLLSEEWAMAYCNPQNCP